MYDSFIVIDVASYKLQRSVQHIYSALNLMIISPLPHQVEFNFKQFKPRLVLYTLRLIVKTDLDLFKFLGIIS